MNEVTDEELLKEETESIKSRIEHLESVIYRRYIDNAKITEFLDKANNYNPPSEAFENIKQFMIEQLQTTLDHDCDYKYYEKELNELKSSTINVCELRERKLKYLNHDLEYHKERLVEEVTLCDVSNKWAKTFLNSLK